MDHKDRMEEALDAVGDGPLYLAHELRLMADGLPPYTAFADASPITKNIWRAASELLEQAHITSWQ